jgi:tRNA G37 N-methylase TrmD
VRGERAELKKWRAWAAWAVTRHVRPDLAGDPKHTVTEPTHAEIEAGLRAYGLVSEIAEWRQALAD